MRAPVIFKTQDNYRMIASSLAFFLVLAESDMGGLKHETRNLFTYAILALGQPMKNPGYSKCFVNFITNGAEIRAWNISVIMLVWILAEYLKKKVRNSLPMEAFPEIPKKHRWEVTVILVQGILRATEDAQTEHLPQCAHKTTANRILPSHVKIPWVGWAPRPPSHCGTEISRKGRLALLSACPFFPYTSFTSLSTSQNSGPAWNTQEPGCHLFLYVMKIFGAHSNGDIQRTVLCDPYSQGAFNGVRDWRHGHD